MMLNCPLASVIAALEGLSPIVQFETAALGVITVAAADELVMLSPIMPLPSSVNTMLPLAAVFVIAPFNFNAAEASHRR